jgi:hypothetical protein
MVPLRIAVVSRPARIRSFVENRGRVVEWRPKQDGTMIREGQKRWQHDND